LLSSFMLSLDKFLANTHSKSHCRKMSQEHKDFLSSLYPSYPIKFQVWFYRHGYKTEPRCAVCSGTLNKVDAKTCSISCREQLHQQKNTHKKSREKAKQTCLKKYGVANVAQLAEVQAARIQSNIEKYGSKVSDKTRAKAKDRAKNLNNKGRATLKEKYGVDNPGQLANHREKCLKTFRLHTGVDHFTKTTKWQNKQTQKKHNKWNHRGRGFVSVTSVDPVAIPGYENPNDRITFCCRTCNSTETMPSETYRWRLNQNISPCSKCNGLSKGSLAEQEIADFLAEHTTVTRHRRDLIAPFELDIYLPEYTVAVEFNGLFWHSDLRLDKNYHLSKTEKCQEKNIQLIHIFEDQWTNQKEIVKSWLLDALGKNQVVDARQCKIVLLDPETAIALLTANHLQGATQADVYLGLEFKDIIVAVMSLRNSYGEWELTRYCPALNADVKDGASKLLQHFIANFSPTSIITHSDRCWDDLGTFYISLGFEFLYYTAPAMRNSDYRVWDCGSSKWLWAR
jgi:predicted nucleic acid-binding Zn ribbon protein